MSITADPAEASALTEEVTADGRVCECWAEDHYWRVDGACGRPAERRVRVDLYFTECDQGCGPHRRVYLLCSRCATDMLRATPPGVVSVFDVGPL